MIDQAPERSPVPGGGLLHPVPVVAIVLLLLNDHVWKAAYPGALWTGKLSDFAGLAFFPLFLQALVEAGQELLRRSWRPSRRVLAAAAVATALVFTLVQVWPPASEAYRVVFGAAFWPVGAARALLSGAELPGWAAARLHPDPWDLVAVPAVAVGVLAGRRRSTDPQRTAPPSADPSPPTC